MRILTYILIVTFFYPFSLLSKEKAQKYEYTFEVGAFSQFRSGGNFFDKDGDNIDKIYVQEFGDTVIWNVYDHSAILTGIYADYQINSQLKLGLEIPFAIYYQDPVHFEEFFIENHNPNPLSPDSLLFTQRTELGELSNNRLLYTSIKGQYFILDPEQNKVLPYISADVRIPFSFEEGTQNASQEYWDDYFFEVITSIGADFFFEKSNLRIKAAYDFRAEDMSDLILLNLKAGLSTVENTELYFQTEYAQSIDNPVTEFNVFRRPYAETYWNLGFGFNFIYNFIVFNVNYNLPVWGKYYWRASILNASVGYRF